MDYKHIYSLTSFTCFDLLGHLQGYQLIKNLTFFKLHLYVSHYTQYKLYKQIHLYVFLLL
jgi:hypothetical protein